jgi:hypothetical protein
MKGASLDRSYTTAAPVRLVFDKAQRTGLPGLPDGRIFRH